MEGDTQAATLAPPCRLSPMSRLLLLVSVALSFAARPVSGQFGTWLSDFGGGGGASVSGTPAASAPSPSATADSPTDEIAALQARIAKLQAQRLERAAAATATQAPPPTPSAPSVIAAPISASPETPPSPAASQTPPVASQPTLTVSQSPPVASQPTPVGLSQQAPSVQTPTPVVSQPAPAASPPAFAASQPTPAVSQLVHVVPPQPPTPSLPPRGEPQVPPVVSLSTPPSVSPLPSEALASAQPSADITATPTFFLAPASAPAAAHGLNTTSVTAEASESQTPPPTVPTVATTVPSIEPLATPIAVSQSQTVPLVTTPHVSVTVPQASPPTLPSAVPVPESILVPHALPIEVKFAMPPPPSPPSAVQTPVVPTASLSIVDELTALRLRMKELEAAAARPTESVASPAPTLAPPSTESLEEPKLDANFTHTIDSSGLASQMATAVSSSPSVAASPPVLLSSPPVVSSPVASAVETINTTTATEVEVVSTAGVDEELAALQRQLDAAVHAAAHATAAPELLLDPAVAAEALANFGTVLPTPSFDKENASSSATIASDTAESQSSNSLSVLVTTPPHTLENLIARQALDTIENLSAGAAALATDPLSTVAIDPISGSQLRSAEVNHVYSSPTLANSTADAVNGSQVYAAEFHHPHDMTMNATPDAMRGPPPHTAEVNHVNSSPTNANATADSVNGSQLHAAEFSHLHEPVVNGAVDPISGLPMHNVEYVDHNAFSTAIESGSQNDRPLHLDHSHHRYSIPSTPSSQGPPPPNFIDEHGVSAPLSVDEGVGQSASSLLMLPSESLALSAPSEDVAAVHGESFDSETISCSHLLHADAVLNSL